MHERALGCIGDSRAHTCLIVFQGIPKDDLSKLPDILDALPSAQLRAMQIKLLRYRSLFLWPPYGYAYNITLYQLCRRVHNLRERPQLTDGRANLKKALAFSLGKHSKCLNLLPAAVKSMIF